MDAVRIQGLVLKSDGLPAGEITKWEWHGLGTGEPNVFHNFKMSLCHTGLGELGTTYASNYAGNTPVKVLEAVRFNFPAYGDDWFGWDFTQTFHYSGQDNLIIEVWWDGHDTDGGIISHISSGGPGRTVYATKAHGQPFHGYPDAGKIMRIEYYMRVTLRETGVENSALGRIKAVFR
jgi:hypothetical protein